MSNPVTAIKNAAKARIEAMATPVYQFSWGSANVWEPAKIETYPSCLVRCPGEVGTDYDRTGADQCSSINTIDMKIKVWYRMTTKPTHIEDQEDVLLNCLVDLKKLFLNNSSIDDTCQSIYYQDYKMINQKTNDIMEPYVMETFWKVVYQQSRAEPSQRTS